MTTTSAGAERRLRVRWIGYAGREPAEPPRDDCRRPDVLVLAVQLTEAVASDISLLTDIRGEADVVAAVIYTPPGAGPAGTAARAALRAVRESADVVVHGSDPGLVYDVLAGIGALEDAPASAER